MKFFELKTLKELNAEGIKLFNEYQEHSKHTPQNVVIVNKDRFYDEVGKNFDEELEMIDQKVSKERAEWNEKADELCEAMDEVLAKIDFLMNSMFDNDNWGLWIDFLETYAPDHFYVHPSLHFSISSMIAVAKWERIEKVLDFVYDWYLLSDEEQKNG